MDGRHELIERCARRRAQKLGGLSEKGYAELLLAIEREPADFIDDPADEAFLHFVEMLERYEADLADDDMLDDMHYLTHRHERREVVATNCQAILHDAPELLDVRTVAAKAASEDPEAILDELLALEARVDAKEGPLAPLDSGDAYDDVFVRPRLRLSAAIASLLLETARYRMAQERCAALVELSPADHLGARRTWALALARLEDEEGFNSLEERFGRRGDAWFYLAHTLLLFKLDRLVAARRAIAGFCDVCRGGAYALLRPTFLERYLLDRPTFEPNSFEEAQAAVHEAEPLICDAPEFVMWAESQANVVASAQAFAKQCGFDW